MDSVEPTVAGITTPVFDPRIISVAIQTCCQFSPDVILCLTFQEMYDKLSSKTQMKCRQRSSDRPCTCVGCFHSV